MKKIFITSLLLATTLITAFPMSASAEWKQDSKGWWNTEGSSYSTGWKSIDGKWYYFNSDGYMAHDTTIDAYALGSDGAWENNILSTTTKTTSVSQKPSKEKFKSTPDFSWFEENGNTYFKTTECDYSTGVVDDEPCIAGPWNIDDSLYSFDKNGVLQKGEVTIGNSKYLFGSDGKYIKCISDESARLYSGAGLTTKSTQINTKVDFDDQFKKPHIYESDSYFGDKAKPTVGDRTLNCKTGQTIRLDDFLVYTTDFKSTTTTYKDGNGGTDRTGMGLLPHLIVKSESSDNNVAFLGIKLYKCDGEMRGIIPYIIAKNPGKTTITVDVNGTKTSLDVVVTE